MTAAAFDDEFDDSTLLFDAGLEPEPVGWPAPAPRRPTTPYRDGWKAHRSAGWPGVIAISRPRDGKGKPLRRGWIGHHGVDPTAAACAELAARNGGANIALRLPRGVVGLDVDHHQMPGGHWKVGAETIAERARQAGPLPATWKLTSRGPGISGRHLYRLPPGYEDAVLISALRDVETIQRHLRYSLTWPSTNGHDHGRVVRWYDPWDEVSDRVPSPEELSELPVSWVENLLASNHGPRAAGIVDVDTMAAFWASVPEGPPCSAVASLLARAELHASHRRGGSRYDATRNHVAGLLLAADSGHIGVVGALERLRRVYVGHQRDAGDTVKNATTEFDRFSGLCCAGGLSGDCLARSRTPRPGEHDTGLICPGQRVVGLVLDRRDVEAVPACLCPDNWPALIASLADVPHIARQAAGFLYGYEVAL